MSQKEEKTASMQHPNPIDRNRSITWARYRLDCDDWILIAAKVTREDESDGSKPSLVTIAVQDHKGSKILEAMVRASDVVSNEEIARHGVDYSLVFNARPYPEIRAEILEQLQGKTIVAWDFSFLKAVFDELDNLHGLDTRRWEGESVSHEYARFVGKATAIEQGYDPQPLPLTGISALDECRSVRKALAEIAQGSQVTDSVASGRPGWTAEFYKPQVNTKDRIKGLFGLKP